MHLWSTGSYNYLNSDIFLIEIFLSTAYEEHLIVLFIDRIFFGAEESLI